MSQFSANIKAILDTKGIPSQIKKIENDTSITLKKFSLDTSGLPSQIQASLDKHKFTINLDGIKMGNMSSDMKDKGTKAGKEFSQALVDSINTKISTNSIDASISKVQQKFNKLNNAIKITGISSADKEITGRMSKLEKDLALLNSLKKEFKTSGMDDATLVSKYDDFNNALLRVRNNLDIVTNSTRQFATANQVATLQNKMEKFLNSDTKAAKKYGDAVKRLNDELKIMSSNGGVDIEDYSRVSGEFGDIDRTATQAGLKVKSFATVFKHAFESISKYVSVATLIRSSLNTVKDMVKNVRDLDTAMASLRKVSDATDSEYKAFFERSKKNAVEYATSLKDIISSTADFSRLGYSLADSEELAKVASVYNEIGDIDNIEKATQSIVSSFAAFKKEGIEAIDIADKFNEVGNNFAISSDGLGEAFQRSASSLAAANNDINKSIALITAGNTVTQDPESVGTAMKTLTMRLRGAQTELEKEGLDSEGILSTATLRKEIKALSGVDILLDKNTFKDTYTIMDELASKWQSLDDIQRATITEIVAGKLCQNVQQCA